jgi:Mat/Ecp fimbriae major subunit
MTAVLRIMTRLIVLALLAAAPLGHAQAATTTVQANAKVVKALSLSAVQDLDFGTVIVPNTPGTYTLSISVAGVLSCPAPLSCSGTTRPAILNVSGSNSQVVRIFAAASDLVNPADGSRIRFTPAAPATITLTNSGSPGKDFNVGGSLSIPSTVTGGTYSGNVEITVDYQ